MRLLRDGCTIAIEDEKNHRKKSQMLLQDIDSVVIDHSNSLVISYSYHGVSVSAGSFYQLTHDRDLTYCMCLFRPRRAPRLFLLHHLLLSSSGWKH